jgi:membrane-associated protease RseP (regulator of RpoE activity)
VVKNFTGLIGFIAFLVAIAFLNLGVALFIYALLIVIMIHESGHFLVAKLFGFKATKFFLGFGPTLWSTEKGETEYGVKAIPAGGFVKIIGMSPYEEIDPEDEARSYPNKPRWQRALLLVAGSATHWVVAFVILLIVAFGVGFPGAPTTQITQVVESVRGVETAAARAGLQPGDTIVALDGSPTSDWREIVRYIEAHANESGHFTIVRDGEEIQLDIPIVEAIVGDQGPVAVATVGGELRAPKPGEKLQGFLGVSPEQQTERAGFIEGFKYAGTTVAEFTARSITSLPEVFKPVFNGDLWRSLSEPGQRDAQGAVGLVGAGRVAGAAVEAGMYAELLQFIAGLTIFIGLMNLLPLPPLDGGHLAVLLIEKITGKPIDVKKLIPVAAVVIAFFLALFVAVLYLDLAHPIEVPF